MITLFIAFYDKLKIKDRLKNLFIDIIAVSLFYGGIVL